MGDIKDIARIHFKGVILELGQIGEDLPVKYSLFWFERVWEEQTCKITTHKIDGKVVGFATTIDNETMIYVDPEYHRQGIGSKLLGDTKEVWVLDGNKMAEGFYKKNGFNKTDMIRKCAIFGNELKENFWLRGGYETT